MRSCAMEFHLGLASKAGGGGKLVSTKDGMRAAGVILALLMFHGAVWAEKIETAEQATHVVIGTVKTVDVHSSLGFDVLASYLFRQYRAAIAVEAAASGQGVQPGQTIYVRYWCKDWVPLSLIVILGLAFLGFFGLKRAIESRVVRWLMTVVLVAAALIASLLSVPMAGMFGHKQFPQEGDRVRALLKANSSGEYDALYPQWVGDGAQPFQMRPLAPQPNGN